MHTPECPPANATDDELRLWSRTRWPKGAPAEIDVSTLPAAGALTSKLRIPEACAEYPWIGFWGNYAGLRAGFSPSESFQVLSPCAVAYPFLGDLYLSADTGGAGIVSVAAFATREAALAFGGGRPSYTSKIPPSTTAFTPSDAQANPTGIAGSEAFTMVWDANTATWKRAAGSSADTDGLTATVGAAIARAWNYAYDVTTGAWDRVRGYGNSIDALAAVAINAGAGIFQAVVSFPYVFNDRTTNLDRLRQPDSFTNWFVVGNDTSLATGSAVVATRTMTQNGWLNRASIYVTSATTYAGRATLYITRAAVKYSIQSTSTNIAQFQSSDLIGTQAIPVLSGDVITIETDTGTASATADIYFAGKQDRFAF